MLQSNLITLRAPEPDDLNLLYQWENDTSLWHYGYTLNPLSKKALLDFIINCSENVFETKQTRFMIIESATGKQVGAVDLYELDSFHQRVGIGVIVAEPFQQKGFAKETLRLIKEYVFEWLHLNQMFAHIPAGNEASLALFRASGFEQNGILKNWIRWKGSFEDVVLMQCLNQSS